LVVAVANLLAPDVGGMDEGEGETNLESVVQAKTDARLVALAEDCKVEKLSCALQLVSFRSPDSHPANVLTAEQPCTRTTLAHIDMKNRQ
jgi:hypothetical protein